MEGGSRNTMANTARDRDITRQSSVSQNLDKKKHCTQRHAKERGTYNVALF